MIAYMVIITDFTPHLWLRSRVQWRGNPKECSENFWKAWDYTMLFLVFCYILKKYNFLLGNWNFVACTDRCASSWMSKKKTSCGLPKTGNILCCPWWKWLWNVFIDFDRVWVCVVLMWVWMMTVHTVGQKTAPMLVLCEGFVGIRPGW